MALSVLLIGKSGSGKSSSMRNFKPDEISLVNVLGKPLPFRGKFAQLKTDDYTKVYGALNNATNDIIVIDDAGYLITNQFMRGHSSAGAGNGVFALYNQIGDNFWQLVELAKRLPPQKRVYFIMHEDKNDYGDVRPKTIGKLLDEKIDIAGLFTIVLRCAVKDRKHIFETQSDGYTVAKTPIGLFETEEIDNDLAYVDSRICEYYGIEKGKADKTA